MAVTGGAADTAPACGSLEIRGLVRAYGRRRVVDGLDLSISPGEVVGLLGPNGAGKTTTLRIAMGFDRPSAGDVRLAGRSILALPVERRARLGLGYLPQEPSVFPDLGVRDNLAIVLEALGRPLGGIDAVLDTMGLAGLAAQKAGLLSGGERRRLEVGRLLCLDPALCLLDEPFTGMDPKSIDRISDIIGSLRDRGKGILVSDHNVRQTIRICDRVTLVDAGRVLVSGSPREVVENPQARDRYFGSGFEA